MNIQTEIEEIEKRVLALEIATRKSDGTIVLDNDALETIMSVYRRAIPSLLSKFAASIDGETKHEGSKVSYHPMSDGTIFEISTYFEKQAWNAHHRSVAEKAEEIIKQLT